MLYELIKYTTSCRQSYIRVDGEDREVLRGHLDVSLRRRGGMVPLLGLSLGDDGKLRIYRMWFPTSDETRYLQLPSRITCYILRPAERRKNYQDKSIRTMVTRLSVEGMKLRASSAR